MDDKRSKSRWEKSIDEAGLMDELEEGWILPNDSIPGGTIRVQASVSTDSKKGESDDEREDPTVPVAEKEMRRLAADSWADISSPTGEDDDPQPATVESSPAPTITLPPAETGESSVPPAVELAEEEVELAVDETPVLRDEPQSESPPAAETTGRTGRKPFVKKEIPARRIEMRESFEVGNYSGALELAEMLLDHDPDDAEGKLYQDKCQQVLLEMYESRIGAFDRCPNLAIDKQEVIWRNLDPKDSFVLSQIDGCISFDDLLDISGLSRFETCRILDNLLQGGIIK